MDYSNFQNTQTNAVDGEMTDEEVQNIVQNSSPEELLEFFAEQLLIDKGVTEQDEDIRREMRMDLVEQLNGAINDAIVAALPEDKLDEINAFAEYSENVDKEKIAEIIRSAGLDLDEITKKTMEDFRNQYLGKE